MFQYISCCSLSCGKNIDISSFHVFQYISCCSLSLAVCRNCPTCTEFQYISCCSLSKTYRSWKASHYGFNTSHVVVYQYRDMNTVAFIPCFNTSHVVVYLSEESKVGQTIICFNTSHVVVYHNLPIEIEPWFLFQYISCCSLSFFTFSF